MEDWNTVYKSKKKFMSDAVSKSFGGMYVKGEKMVTNPFVENGGLTGRTDTDYFYFNCPGCKGVLQWLLREVKESESRYDHKIKKDIPATHLRIELWCDECQMGGTVKIDNDCWQGGRLTDSGPEPDATFHTKFEVR